MGRSHRSCPFCVSTASSSTGHGPDPCPPVLCFSGCCLGCLGGPSYDCIGGRWLDHPPPPTPCSRCAFQRLKERQGDARHLRKQGIVPRGWGQGVSSHRQDEGRGPLERVTQSLAPHLPLSLSVLWKLEPYGRGSLREWVERGLALGEAVPKVGPGLELGRRGVGVGGGWSQTKGLPSLPGLQALPTCRHVQTLPLPGCPRLGPWSSPPPPSGPSADPAAHSQPGTGVPVLFSLCFCAELCTCPGEPVQTAQGL